MSKRPVALISSDYVGGTITLLNLRMVVSTSNCHYTLALVDLLDGT